MQILKAKKPDTNVGEAERWLSLIGGSSLVAYGLARRNSAGFGLAALGGSLLVARQTGHCPMYETLGVNTAERGYAKGTGSRAGVPYELGIRVDHEIHVNKSVDEVYAFWRELEQPVTVHGSSRVREGHQRSVVALDGERSHRHERRMGCRDRQRHTEHRDRLAVAGRFGCR